MESVWYYAHSGAQTGPVSFGDLQSAAVAGKLSPEDLVWREGTPDWVAARTVAGLFPAPAAPPPPPPRMPAPMAMPSRASTHGVESLPLADEATPAPPPVSAPPPGSEIIDMAKLFVRRAAAADPAAIVATRDEERLLAQSGFEPTTRKFVVWRRALLWVAAVPAAFASLFALISLLDMETNEKAMLSPFGTLVYFIQVFALCALPFVAAFAALGYNRPAKSARLVFIGGLVITLVPVLIAFLPTGWLIAGPGPTGDSGEVQLMKAMYAQKLGPKYYLLVLPIILSVTPALSRACVRLKGFLPESIVPGWALVASAPVVAFLTLATFIVIYRTTNNFALFLGLLLVIGAPLLYLMKFRLLTRPVYDAREMAAFTKTQLYVIIATAVGFLMIVIYLFSAQLGDHKVLGTNRDAEWRIWSLDAHKTWLEYLARSLFLTVFFADLLVRMAVMVWREERAFAGTGPAASFDQTMSAMGEAVEVKGNAPVA